MTYYEQLPYVAIGSFQRGAKVAENVGMCLAENGVTLDDGTCRVSSLVAPCPEPDSVTCLLENGVTLDAQNPGVCRACTADDEGCSVSTSVEGNVTCLLGNGVTLDADNPGVCRACTTADEGCGVSMSVPQGAGMYNDPFFLAWTACVVNNVAGDDALLQLDATESSYREAWLTCRGNL